MKLMATLWWEGEVCSGDSAVCHVPRCTYSIQWSRKMKMFDIGRGTNFFSGDIVHVATVDPH